MLDDADDYGAAPAVASSYFPGAQLAVALPPPAHAATPAYSNRIPLALPAATKQRDLTAFMRKRDPAAPPAAPRPAARAAAAPSLAFTSPEKFALVDIEAEGLHVPARRHGATCCRAAGGAAGC